MSPRRSRRRLRTSLLATAAALLIIAIGGAVLSSADSSHRPAASPRRPAAASNAACAPTDRHLPASSRAGASEQLVPGGATSALLCRYDGPFGRHVAGRADHFSLVAAQQIDSPRLVGLLTREFNELPSIGDTGDCVDTKAAIVASFGYGTGPTDPVRVDLIGCIDVTNGHLLRTAGTSFTTLLNRLEALVHARRSKFRPRHTPAIIDGEIRLCGGPAPGGCFSSTMTACTQGHGCSRSDRVVAIDDAGVVIAVQKLYRAHGHFRLRVPSGNYAVELLADGSGVHDRMLAAKGARARPDHPASVVFPFNVP